MKKYDGHCEGNCYECICQECEGNCAMHCLTQSCSEKIAKMDDDETHVMECCEFEQMTDR